MLSEVEIKQKQGGGYHFMVNGKDIAPYVSDCSVEWKGTRLPRLVSECPNNYQQETLGSPQKVRWSHYVQGWEILSVQACRRYWHDNGKDLQNREYGVSGL